MKKSTKILLGLICVLFTTALFMACGEDSSDDETTPDPKYTVGGIVSGLSGTLVLQCNGTDDETITSDGAFAFSTKIADGNTYAVTTHTIPVLQRCSVSNDSGTISGADINDVAVDCTDKWTHPSFPTNSISLDGQNAATPWVAMDNNGNAIIVWHQRDGSTDCSGGACTQIFKSEFRGGSWTHPSSLSDNISPDGQNAYSARVAMNDNGNAIITWYQLDGSTDCSGSACQQIFKSEFRGGSWNHPTFIANNISPDGQKAFSPQVAMDNSGNAIIVWYQYDGSTDCGGSACQQIFKSEYRSGSWNHPTFIANSISPDGHKAYKPQVAMDNSGNAIVVWEQDDSSTDCFGLPCSQVFKSEYRGGSWNHPTFIANNISPDGQGAYTPQVAMDNSGNAIVAWAQYDDSFNCGGSSCTQIFKSEFRSGSWTHPSDLTDNISPDGQYVYIPWVAMDNSGNAIVVWYQGDMNPNCSGYPCTNIYKSEYRAGSWTHPSSLADYINPDGPYPSYPRVAMDGIGNAIIVWEQHDGSTDCSGGPCKQTFKSEYRAGSWTHPSSLADNISPDGQYAYTPQVAMDSSGNAIIVWHQLDNSTDCGGSPCTQIFKSEFR